MKDFGDALKVGAYMSSLRRTKIGEYEVTNAIQWQDLQVEIEALIAGSDGTMNQEEGAV